MEFQQEEGLFTDSSLRRYRLLWEQVDETIDGRQTSRQLEVCMPDLVSVNV